MNNREVAYKHFMQEEMRIGKSYQDIFNAGYQAALASQAQQESKQGCKECDGQTYIHSLTGEYLGECPFCTKEEEPYAYDVPTKDGTELAYAIYFTKYNNPLPEGAIPLYLQSQAQQKPVSKDWAEDFAHENGMYQIICCVCECAFIGHKRRVICKECAQQPAPEGE